MHRLLVLAAATAVAGLLTGCAAATTTGGAAASSPVASSSSGTSSKQAWTRGTHATITNSSAAAVQVGAGACENNAPTFAASALPAGESLTTDDGRGVGGSSIGARITYPDGNVAEFRLVNPAVGTPYAQWRKGPSPFVWSDDLGDYTSLGEGESTTATVAGHAVTFTRLADDADNKNWTVSLN